MSSIKEIILVLIGINLCTTAVVYIIKHNVVVWYFMIIACIIEIIVTRLEYDYLSKKNLHEKIIKMNLLQLLVRAGQEKLLF